MHVKVLAYPGHLKVEKNLNRGNCIYIWDSQTTFRAEEASWIRDEMSSRP